MKRRNFIKASAVVGAVSASGAAMASTSAQAGKKEIYEMRIYRYTNGGGKSKVDNFYQNSLIPFLNKRGVKVGAFGEYSKNEPAVGYFLLIYPSITEYQQIKNDLWKDQTFMESAKSYFDSTAQTGAYFRFSSYLLEPFDAFSQLQFPNKNRQLIELRTYESNNEEAGQRKIRMFNSAEIDIFKSVGLNLVFFGEILAGPQMPALMYMLSYENMQERDDKWKKFAESDAWKQLSAKPEFANSVSTVNKVFLVPLGYSQI
jgi:hypothetical protein